MSSLAKADLAHRSVPLFSPQRLQLSMEAQSFKTHSNFLSTGVRSELPSDFRFLTYDVVFSSMYDLSEEWAISGDLGVSYAESYSNSDLRVNREVRDLKLGLYRLYDTTYLGRFIIDGFYLLNFISNKDSYDEVSVGDGVSWVQAGFWWEPRKTTHNARQRPAQKKSDESDSVSAFRGIFRTYLGFRSRFGGFSDVLIYKIHPQMAYKKFLLGAELNGMVSVIDEGESSKIAKEVYNSNFNASSFRYNAWNPHMLEAMGWAGYQIQPYTQVRLGISQVLGLKNVADGMGFFLDIQTSMTVTPSGMFFSDFFGHSKKLNPRRNNIEIPDLGPTPKVEKKPQPSDLQDL